MKMLMTMLALIFCAANISAAEAKNPKPLLKVNENAEPAAAGAPLPPAGYVTPAQIRHAYGFDLNPGLGSNQTVAIIVAYGNPNAEQDLQFFSNAFGLPTGDLTIAYPQGAPQVTDALWALETDMDIEWSHAIAPSAKILLVVAQDNSWENLMGAVDYAVEKGARQVSMSFGAVEFPQETEFDVHFNVPGVSFFASSGDAGGVVEYPAASPYVTAVGATTLHLDSAGDILQPESVWINSGGGISAFEGSNAFQNAWSDPTPGSRMVPDVSYNGDPTTGFAIYNTYGYNGLTGWMQVGGTSAGSEQWASLMAVANGQRRHIGLKSTTSSNSAIYSLGNPENLDTFFRDIVLGIDGAGNAIQKAAVGYDTASGLGTPQASTLINGLSTLRLRPNNSATGLVMFDRGEASEDSMQRDQRK